VSAQKDDLTRKLREVLHREGEEVRKQMEMYRDSIREMSRQLEEAMELARPQLSAIQQAIRDFTEGTIVPWDLNRLRP